MSKYSATGSFKIESHYAKQADGFVYYYWRIVGLGDWNIQKTVMRNVPTLEMVTEIRNKALAMNRPHSLLTTPKQEAMNAAANLKHDYEKLRASTSLSKQPKTEGEH